MTSAQLNRPSLEHEPNSRTVTFNKRQLSLQNKYVVYFLTAVTLALPTIMISYNLQMPLEQVQGLTRYLPNATVTDPSRQTVVPIPQITVPKCLVFFHLPKCAGRSLIEFLESVALGVMNFTEQRTYVHKPADRNMKLTDLQANNTFTLGHFTTILFRDRPDFRDCFKLTVMREPVDRAISAFYFHGKNKYHLDRCLSAKSDHRACTYHWQYSNDMTRQLGGSRDRKWNTYFEHVINVPPSNGTDLENAKAALIKYFDLVCFMNDLPSCADSVLNAFHLNRSDARLTEGLSHMTATLKEKSFATKTRPNQLDNRSITLFRDANNLDLELYEWAVENIKMHDVID